MNRFLGILDMFFYTTDTIDGEKTSLAFFFPLKTLILPAYYGIIDLVNLFTPGSNNLKNLLDAVSL